jgi:hypothetical protein
MRRYELRALRRALRRPARTLLKFEPVSSDRRRVRGQVRASDTKTWTAADHKHAFTITREFDADVSTSVGESRPFFVVHVSQLDGSYRRGGLAKGVGPELRQAIGGADEYASPRIPKLNDPVASYSTPTAVAMSPLSAKDPFKK